MDAELKIDHELDLRGQSCPLPVINTRKFLTTMRHGQILKVLSSDPAAISDFRALVYAIGMESLGHRLENGQLEFIIRKT